jgi:hypothetical protein
VAALWGAMDDAGTIYLFAEHVCSHGEPSENARAIKAPGSWIPGTINLSRIGGSQIDKYRIAELYSEQGLKVEISRGSDEVGMFHFSQALAANKLKVFASLSRFLEEYRIADEQSPLLLCCRSLLLDRDCMRTKPVKHSLDFSPTSSGSWMG